MDATRIVPGMIVRLKTGGPMMTVSGRGERVGYVQCSFFVLRHVLGPEVVHNEASGPGREAYNFDLVQADFHVESLVAERHGEVRYGLDGFRVSASCDAKPPGPSVSAAFAPDADCLTLSVNEAWLETDREGGEALMFAIAEALGMVAVCQSKERKTNE